jgi:(1->4)-alpha-D-glucan 1-alpha-D-glucosylmutase
VNSLTQSLLRFTAPGVPDTYQGGELWDYRLVDPDNRTPVDYQARQSMLDELKAGLSVNEIMEREDSGLPKLWLTMKALHLRREHPEWFGADAEYQALYAEGEKAAHVIAFARAGHVAAVAQRWTLKLGESWAGTALELPQGPWTNLLTGEQFGGGRLRIQALLRRFPVALLVKAGQ